MSKRAEEAALKAYPRSDFQSVETSRKTKRKCFIGGYEQAEQDLALTWEDIAILITIYEQEVEDGNISRYEDEGAPSLQDASEIILRRFNELIKQLKQE